MENTKLINFFNLSLQEKEMVLSWRNNPNIKKWMVTNEDITLEQHLNFIDSLKTKEDRVYFLVKKDNEFIGVVDLTAIQMKESAELGIYINPALKGYGSLLMQKIIDYAFNSLELKKLYANVFIENERAINLYKNFNFNIVKIIENAKMYSMELKNENR